MKRKSTHPPSLFTIATLGSHSALQILKGAKDEGFHTLAVMTPQNERLYSSFGFVDEVMVIPRYSDFPKLEKELNRRKVVLVPHGSFVAYLSLEEHKAMTTPYFGNKAVLDGKPTACANASGCSKRASRCRGSSPKQARSTAQSSSSCMARMAARDICSSRTRKISTARASHLVEQKLHHAGIRHRRSRVHPLLLFAADR